VTDDELSPTTNSCSLSWGCILATIQECPSFSIPAFFNISGSSMDLKSCSSTSASSDVTNTKKELFLVRNRSAAGMMIRKVVLVVGPVPRLSCEPISGAINDVFVFRTAALPGSTVIPRTDTSYTVDGCKPFTS